jgi:F0F1-type ATP synthase membrane subunit c/vacuolar-type H+-ATPase subunit K
MQNPQQIEAKAEARHRIILTLWFALLMSISVLFVMTIMIPSNTTEPNTTLSLALIGAAFMMVAGSVLIKQRIVQRAVEKRDAKMLQTGYILSFALSESAAIWGLVGHLVTGSSYYYFSFTLGVLGMILHFPKKDHVRATIT